MSHIYQFQFDILSRDSYCPFLPDGHYPVAYFVNKEFVLDLVALHPAAGRVHNAPRLNVIARDTKAEWSARFDMSDELFVSGLVAHTFPFLV
jgi:hypothetical protein